MGVVVAVAELGDTEWANQVHHGFWAILTSFLFSVMVFFGTFLVKLTSGIDLNGKS